jgi:hypothetical protein
MTDHPPKPRLTLRVGITGHRPNKLPRTDLPRIERQLREVFAAIETAVARIRDAKKTDGAIEPTVGSEPYSIRFISGFAEGADQLAVAACPAHWTVEAILPFPRDEYLKDFAQSAAGDGRDVRGEFLASLARAAIVTELPMPPAGPREQGYVLSGRFLLQQINLLVAVWDGEDPKPGGTGAVVREARERGIPVIWLATGGDKPIVFIQTFKDDKPVRANTDWNEQTLQVVLDPILAA